MSFVSRIKSFFGKKKGYDPIFAKKEKSMVRRFAFLIPILFTAILMNVLPRFPEFTENVFSAGIFRVLSAIFSFLTSHIPISITEILVLLALPFLIVSIILFIRRMIKSKSKQEVVGHMLHIIVWILADVFLLLMFMHGFNFYRKPAKELMKLDTSAEILYTPEFVQSVCIDLAKKSSATREKLSSFDENGNMTLSKGINPTLKEAGAGYSVLLDEYPFLWGSVNKVKPVMLSHYWSYTGIGGMYFPLLGEANVNTDQPAADIPFASAHEIAHTRGFAREDEANFFAYLSCINHPNLEYQYSGYINTYLKVERELRQYNTEDKNWFEDITPHLSKGVISDFVQAYDYWDYYAKKYDGVIMSASDKANDSFIQAHGVPEGLDSYNMMTELVLAYYNQNEQLGQDLQLQQNLE